MQHVKEKTEKPEQAAQHKGRARREGEKMTKVEQLQNVVTVLAKVAEFGPFKIVTHLGDLEAVGGFRKYHTPEAWEPGKFVALLAQTTGGEALAVTDQGGVVKLTHEQAAGVPNSGEWMVENVHNFGKLKNRKTLEEVAGYDFEEFKELPEVYSLPRPLSMAYSVKEYNETAPAVHVYPLAYSVGTYGSNGALALVELEGGAIKLVKSTGRGRATFQILA